MKTFRKKFIIYMFAVLTIISLALSLTFVSKVEAVEEPIDTCTSGGKTTVNITTDIEEKLTDVHFIDNANYFKTNPKHADNKETDCPDGTCTTVAVQMLMGYHNYYTDRRLIPATDENGEAFLVNDYADLTQHPDVDKVETRGDGNLGRKETGTTDKFFYKLFALNPDAANSGGQTYAKVQAGAEAFIEQYASNIKDNVSLSWGLINKTEVKCELDKGNPVIVGRGQISERNFHVMVAYGYASYEGDDGFIVHCGWEYGDSYVWIPSSLLLFQMRMDVNTHTHNFVDTGTYVNSYYREYVCTVCGVNTFESIFTTIDSSIVGIGEPFGQRNVVIPAEIVCWLSKGDRKVVTITDIQAEAFANTMSDNGVYNVTISDGIINIGNGAFRNCGALKSVTLGADVRSIGVEVFDGCDALENIYTPQRNVRYSSVNGVLYNKNKSLLMIYPIAKSWASYTVDSECKELSSYAFADNVALSSLNLVNTKIMNRNAIINCPALTTIIAPNLERMYPSAITETKFAENKADVVLGKVVYKKTSAGEIVEIDENIKTIAPEAFVGNESIKKIVVRGNNFSEICDHAFRGCSTLENIEIYNLNEVVSLGTGALDGVNANLSIKVPQKYLNTYKTETTKGWTSFANKITTLDKLSVKYIVGDKVVKESLVDYGNEIGEDYKYIDGDYYAKTWKTADGTEIKGYHTITDDIVLYGALEPYTFTITYVTNGGEPIATGKYNVENDKELLEATREGYTFKGWYTSPDLAEESKIDLIIRKGTRNGNLTVYAKWQVNTYTVAFDTVVDEQVLPEQHVVFDEPFALGTAYSDGRIFNGWKDENGRMLTNANGVSLFAWDIPKSTTVFADWTLIEYTIEYKYKFHEYISEVQYPENPSKFTVEDLPLRLNAAFMRGAMHKGWFLDPYCTSEQITKIERVDNYVLYAKWAYLFTLDFELNGGDWNNEVDYEMPYVVYSGDRFKLPTAKRDGYNSGHWTRNKSDYDFGDWFTIPENAINEGFRFTAVWSDPNTYTVRFNWNGGNDERTATTSIRIVYDTIAPEIKLPKKAGFIFAKYASGEKVLYRTNAQYELECLRFDFAGDITLTAEWVSPYPELTLLGKNANKWQIKVKNNTHLKLTFTYNAKMCYEKDAKAWSGLSDQKDVTIESEKEADIEIAENWFATCIVVSVKIDQRYITYAYNLKADGTITCVNCTVST